MSDKLHIPGPDEVEDFTELDMSIMYGWAVSMLICIGLFLFFRGQVPAEGPAEPDDPVVAHQQRVIEQAERQPGGLEEHDWEADDAVAVFRHGPREAAEAACGRLGAQLESGELDPKVHLELLKTVDRRATHAPWSCLVRAHLADGIFAELDLAEEVAEFWGEVERFEADASIVASMVDAFRTSRDRPEHADFYGWLRVCGAHPSSGASPACLKLLYQLSPAQGADILAAIDRHLAEQPATQLDSELEVIIAGVGELARRGQPTAWRVEQKGDIDAYDKALRLGAMFQLCRFVNSPDEQVATRAAEQLAETASVAARATDENILYRWRETCRLAYREGDGEEAEPAAALAVWSGKADQAPQYAVSTAVERGDCPELDELPAWYCGVELWDSAESALDLAMMTYFTETRYVEWMEQ